VVAAGGFGKDGSVDKRAKPKLRVGQQVMLISRYGRKGPQPGIVTRVARVYVYIRREGHGGDGDRFRIDTQTDDNSWSVKFQTLPEFENGRARENAIQTLKDHGLEFSVYNPGPRLSTETLLELAAVLTSQPDAVALPGDEPGR
jgi:hypothetical protein